MVVSKTSMAPSMGKGILASTRLLSSPPLDPQEELKMLETMKREIEENMRSLETRIRELRKAIEKEKAK
jgi:hypothetical protein